MNRSKGSLIEDEKGESTLTFPNTNQVILTFHLQPFKMALLHYPFLSFNGKNVMSRPTLNKILPSMSRQYGLTGQNFIAFDSSAVRDQIYSSFYHL